MCRLLTFSARYVMCIVPNVSSDSRCGIGWWSSKEGRDNVQHAQSSVRPHLMSYDTVVLNSLNIHCRSRCESSWGQKKDQDNQSFNEMSTSYKVCFLYYCISEPNLQKVVLTWVRSSLQSHKKGIGQCFYVLVSWWRRRWWHVKSNRSRRWWNFGFASTITSDFQPFSANTFMMTKKWNQQ